MNSVHNTKTLNNPYVWIWQSNSLAVLFLIVSFKLFFIPFFFSVHYDNISSDKIYFSDPNHLFYPTHRLKHLKSLFYRVGRKDIKKIMDKIDIQHNNNKKQIQNWYAAMG